MVLLVDTNIILDVLLNRPEFVKDSSMIWKLCETEQAKGYLSTLTYANIYVLLHYLHLVDLQLLLLFLPLHSIV